MYRISIAICVLLGLTAGAFAQDMRTYTPGFRGYVKQLNYPLFADNPKDRFIKLTVRLPEDPEGDDEDFDTAAIHICLAHRRDLRKGARALRPSSDWRVKVLMQWVLSDVALDKGSVEITYAEYRMLRVFDCHIV